MKAPARKPTRNDPRQEVAPRIAPPAQMATGSGRRGRDVRADRQAERQAAATSAVQDGARAPGLDTETSGQSLPVDLEAAARHLHFLDPQEPRHTYQVAPDVPGAPRRIYHGPLQAVARHLTRANEAGAGINVMVNAGDLRGRKRENVRRVRFVFVDLDGAPVPDDLDAHGLIWSSPGKAHLYWRVDGVPIELFRAVQLGLASTFGGDPSVNDPPRVLRLAGFLHLKRDPFRVFAWWLDHDAPPLTLAEVRARWPHVDAEVRKVLEVRTARPRAAATTARTSTRQAFPERFQGVFAYKARQIVGTGRHELLVWGARALLDNGLTEGEARQELLKARNALPDRDGGPVPDAEVVAAVAWAFANLAASGPWPEPAEPKTSNSASIIPPLLAGRPSTRTRP